MQESINKLIAELFSQPMLGAAHPLPHNSQDSGYEHPNQGDEELTHYSEAAELLYAYIEAELDGLNAGLMFPNLHKQLANSTALQSAHDELRELLVMAKEERLIEPPLVPSFDFSYLKEQAAPSDLLKRSWSFDRMGRLVIEFTAELLQSMLLVDLQPAMVKSAQSSQADNTYQYVLENQVDDLNVEIEIKLDRANPSHCHIAALVAIPSRDGWPNWKNSRVVMKKNDDVLQSQVTNAFGRILFEPIGVELLPTLAFEVTPATQL